jgi:hydroxyacylglutathione hydrolase
MPAHVLQFPCLSDNYGVLLNDPATGATAAIDAPEAGPILAALEGRGWTLTDILVTHHHADHTQGIPELKAKFPKVRITGAAKDAARIEGLDVQVREDDLIKMGTLQAKVIETPGHTSGHIAYWFEEEDLAFVGDTLFAMGCGRVFEGTMPQMWSSLVKLASLPGETQVYCGHEYTLSNARFALTIDPDNEMLQDRMKEVTALREAGKPTVPTTIAIELATNPFLRAEDPAVQAHLGMAGADPAAVFAEIRERKNRS